MIYEFKRNGITLRLYEDGRATYKADGRVTTFNTSDLDSLTYYFADSTKTTLNADSISGDSPHPDSTELWLLILKGEELLERNNNHTETRRHESYNDKNDKWDTLTDSSIDIVDKIIKQADRKVLQSAIATLLPQQRKLLHRVYIQNMSVTEIAHLEGVSKSAICHRLKKIYTRLQRLTAFSI